MSTSTRITLEQLDRMIARGVFQTNEIAPLRRELIDGEIRTMSPIGHPHVVIVTALTYWSIDHTSRNAIWVQVQGSIGIPEHDSAPEPDLVWVQRGYDRSRRAEPHEIVLLIEVADPSLTYDRTIKAALYAAAGIREYWIVNIPERQVEVFRGPTGRVYHDSVIAMIDDTIAPRLVPEARLDVGALFDQLA